MSIATIRTALGSRLTTANTDLRWYDTPPDNPSVPCAFAGFAAGRYKDDFDGDFSFTIPVYVLVANVTNPRAVDAIDAYAEKSGTSSIYAAVAADGDLGGSCHSAIVTDFTEGIDPPFEFLNADYVGVTFTVEVMA